MVTPTLDGDVLAVLATCPEELFTVGQIHRIVARASGEGIRKALARLAAQGVVLQGQVGRTHTYRFNAEHLAAEPILALSGLTATLLRRLEARLQQWPDPPAYAAVFGSAATGQMRPDSDIDLFLVRPLAPGSTGTEEDSYSWDEQVQLLARDVTAWTGNDARIVEYTVEDLRSAFDSGEPLLGDVARHGLTVAGSRAWFTQHGATVR